MGNHQVTKGTKKCKSPDPDLLGVLGALVVKILPDPGRDTTFRREKSPKSQPGQLRDEDSSEQATKKTKGTPYCVRGSLMSGRD